MQFIRSLPKSCLTCRLNRSISTKTFTENKGQRTFKVPRYSHENQQILDNFMVPGPALKYFKTKTEKMKQEDNKKIAQRPITEKLHTIPARPVHYNEFDASPTTLQDQLAKRIHRAILTMYTDEVMPNRWITPDQVTIRSIKVSRNLRKCQVLYEPTSIKKEGRGNVHRALKDYTHLLNTLIRRHAQLKQPISIKFVSDTHSRELEDLFKKISIEIEEQER
ncbi:MAG: hypothetical protein EXX96DRAFT_43082 [Benjaminiella poitrasii]|nr:MAG: hypothetical protein EXX96DRAFT_43082 [Benjaminiella poitrasii]